MGSVTIRNIDDTIKRNARLAAATNGRSLEAELRELLRRTYAADADDRTTRLRAMSGQDAVLHLIRQADGIGIDIPAREHEDIAFPRV